MEIVLADVIESGSQRGIVMDLGWILSAVAGVLERKDREM